ncbi:MAG: heme-binding protein [Verrucomicrobiota bacterium]|nr:heme-binding protein [Verrucomicrobiota bacterium]
MCSAYEQAFARTNVGEFEIKTLPKARLIASQTDAAYFDDNNRLFRPLFRYISSRNIAMTTPVEAEMNPGVMYFYIDDEVSNEVLDATENVSVHELPERLVASLGVRGDYNEHNFNKASANLSAWLLKNPVYKATGKVRGIFWNGPFTPGFFKRFEVHIPVQLVKD